jgi:Glutamate-cysteine ligase.
VKESNLSELLNRRLALLGERANLSLLEQCLHGIERECLRVTAKGAWRKRRTPKNWVPR